MTAFLEIKDLTVTFRVGSAIAARLKGDPVPDLVAVDDITFTVDRGESLGIVGESGCGKSTLARAITGLVPVTSGSISLDGGPLGKRRSKATRRRVQMVFQDPSSSLNPSMTVERTLAELLRVHKIVPRDRIDARCAELMDLVELPKSLLKARPRSLSGGQRQRVGIARALALEPDVLIADEAVAALDVSVQAPVLNLLNQLREELGLTVMFISHDLAVVRYVSDRVIVMYLGNAVEDRSTVDLFESPRHPYTRALMAAAPKFGVKKAPGESAIKGEPPSALDLPSGCRFRPRCPLAEEICEQVEPDLSGASETERTACHFPWEG
ncbi:ABC transporter ATP-binding protein [bacterium]|nr:ABC transporter ATP-binding protein [bacterium]